MPDDQHTEHKSIHRRVFDHYLRTGERLTNQEWLSRRETKFNPYHDERGRFTSPPGVTVSWGAYSLGNSRPGDRYRNSQNASTPSFASNRNVAGPRRTDAPRPTPDSEPAKIAASGNGFNSDLVRDAIAPETSHAPTSFELRRRQAYLDALRRKAGPKPDPIVKADLEEFQTRIDADRARLDENVRRIVDPQTNELLRAGLAPVDIGTGLINVASGDGELDDYLSAASVIPVGADIRRLGWLAQLPRTTAIIDNAPVEIIQLGGPHWKVRLLPKYHSHHIPSKRVSPLREGEGPAIAMLPKDHQATLSYGRGAKQEAHRKAQAELIAKGDFKGAQQLDIDDIKRQFPGRYDEAIEQMLKHIDKGR